MRKPTTYHCFYTYRGPDNLYTVGCLDVQATSDKDAINRWSRAAAKLHNTTEEEMAAGFDGDPILCYTVKGGVVTAT